MLLERALKRRANLVVDPCAANFIRKFHHGDFRPQSAPHAAKFESDDPASDNNHGFRNLFQFQRPRARDDGFLIRIHPRQRARHRPSRQHHILRLNHLRASVLHRHVHFVRAQELPPPFRVRHLILLEQSLDAFGQPRHRFTLMSHHRLHVDRDLTAERDSVFRHPMFRFLVLVARVQQRFARDAPDVQARPAQGPSSLDARHLQPELRRLDRGDVPSRPTADDDDVLLFARRRERARERPRERFPRGDEFTRRPDRDARKHHSRRFQRVRRSRVADERRGRREDAFRASSQHRARASASEERVASRNDDDG